MDSEIPSMPSVKERLPPASSTSMRPPRFGEDVQALAHERDSTKHPVQFEYEVEYSGVGIEIETVDFEIHGAGSAPELPRLGEEPADVGFGVRPAVPSLPGRRNNSPDSPK